MSKNKNIKISYEELKTERDAAVAKAERLGFAYDESTRATNALEQAAGYLGVDIGEEDSDNEVIVKAAKKMRDELSAARKEIEELKGKGGK